MLYCSIRKIAQLQKKHCTVPFSFPTKPIFRVVRTAPQINSDVTANQTQEESVSRTISSKLSAKFRLCFQNQWSNAARQRVPQNKMPRSLRAAMKFSPRRQAQTAFPPPPLRKYIQGANWLHLEIAPRCVGPEDKKCGGGMYDRETDKHSSACAAGPISPSIQRYSCWSPAILCPLLLLIRETPGAITQENGPSWNGIKK